MRHMVVIVPELRQLRSSLLPLLEPVEHNRKLSEDRGIAGDPRKSGARASGVIVAKYDSDARTLSPSIRPSWPGSETVRILDSLLETIVEMDRQQFTLAELQARAQMVAHEREVSQAFLHRPWWWCLVSDVPVGADREFATQRTAEQLYVQPRYLSLGHQQICFFLDATANQSPKVTPARALIGKRIKQS